MVLLKSRIVLLQKNSFRDSNNKSVSYCMVHLVEEELDDENNKGSLIGKVSTKYDNYEKLLPLVGKNCNVEFEYVKNLDGSFKRKLKKVDDIVFE